MRVAINQVVLTSEPPLYLLYPCVCVCVSLFLFGNVSHCQIPQAVDSRTPTRGPGYCFSSLNVIVWPKVCTVCVCATTGCREGDKAAQTSQKTKRGLKLCSGVPAHSSQTLRLSINLLSFLYFPQKFCYKIRLESGLKYSGSQMYSEVCRNHSSRSLTQSVSVYLRVLYLSGRLSPVPRHST